MKKFLMILLVSVFIAGCSGGEGNDKDESKGNDEQTVSEEENEQADNDMTDEEEEEEDVSGAVAPKSSSNTISFDKVNWIGGSPDRKGEPGIWFYTEEEHPEKLNDTFDWDEEDILLWQIGDEAYEGANAHTKKLEIVNDDVIKIVVELEKDYYSDGRIPRNYLKVPKDKLEGKSFIIETVDGESLSVE